MGNTSAHMVILISAHRADFLNTFLRDGVLLDAINFIKSVCKTFKFPVESGVGRSASTFVFPVTFPFPHISL